MLYVYHYLLSDSVVLTLVVWCRKQILLQPFLYVFGDLWRLLYLCCPVKYELKLAVDW